MHNEQASEEIHAFERLVILSAPRLGKALRRGDAAKSAKLLSAVSAAAVGLSATASAFGSTAQGTANGLVDLANQATLSVGDAVSTSTIEAYKKLLEAIPAAHAAVAPLMLDDGNKGGDTPEIALREAVGRAISALIA